MNQERQKTDAIADAVEIPDGATHYNHNTETYYKLENNNWYHWHFTEWRASFYKNGLNDAYITPL